MILRVYSPQAALRDCHVCRCTWCEGFTPPGINGVAIFVYCQRHALASGVAGKGHLRISSAAIFGLAAAAPTLRGALTFKASNPA